MNSKAVSETFGAMLVILVMMLTAGIIYLMSYPTIFSGIDNINYRNALKAIAEIKELAERMKFGSEVATMKTIHLTMGSVYTGGGVNISFEEGGGERSYRLQNLNFEVGGKIVSLESGIFEKTYGKVVPIPISEPSAIATDDTIYFTFYNFTGNFSAGGKVTMSLKYSETKVFNTKRLEIESEFCELWKRTIEKLDSGILEDNDCADRKIVVNAGSREIQLSVVTIEVS
ncbi:MAG: hypothetical protein ACK401_00790 [Archaeoglobaceae archaeon]